MTRPRKILLAVLVLSVAVALWGVLRVGSFRPVDGPPPGLGPLGHPWRGAVHVHSSASADASGAVDDIMRAADAAGIDFVVLSDHNVMAARRPRTAWHGDVLLIVAEEISTATGHLLALEVQPHRYRFGPEARQALDDIDHEGGWALVAHPYHAWQGWRAGWAGTQGVEVANLAAAWSHRGALSRLAAVGSSLVDPDAGALRLLREDWRALREWDRSTAVERDDAAVAQRRVAVGAVDAHGPFIGPLPRHVDTLAALNTVVWIDESPAQARATGDAVATERKLLDGLRRGRAAVLTAALGDERRFDLRAESARGIDAVMGELAPYEDGPWTLQAGFETVAAAELVLLRDGEPVARGPAPALRVSADRPGTYRVEVYRTDAAARDGGGPPWLVSNPVYLWPPALRVGARLRRVPPLPAPPLTRDLLAGADFEANQRGVAANEIEGTRPVLWSFALRPRSDTDDFAAMAWRPEPAQDWSGADGLVVHVGARQRLRVNLEIRARAPGGATESWVYALVAGPSTPAVAIPWDQFRPPWSADLSDAENADPRRPGSADLTRVHGVFLVITPLLLQEGDAAEVELRALGLYGER